jgi:hypothetical protein
MSLADYANYKSRVSSPFMNGMLSKSSITTIAGHIYSLWLAAPGAGAAPTSAVNPAHDLAGSLILTNGMAGGQSQTGATVHRLAQLYYSATQVGTFILCDRLGHSGGLSGTTTGEQTTNLPLGLPARETGPGVWMGLEIYTAIGTTGATATIRYTDSGNNSHTSQVFSFGATGYATASRLCIAPPVSGEWDIKAVQGVTLSGSSGTAGAFGVTLFKPLLYFPSYNLGSQGMTWDSVINMAANMPVIHDEACLFLLFRSITTTSGILQLDMRTILE